MTNESNPVPVAESATVESSAPPKKPRAPHRRMTDDRKADHHRARDAFEQFVRDFPDVGSAWTGMYPDRQTRILSNLLLDYVPDFIAKISQRPFDAAFVQSCGEVLAAAASDVKAYRKANLSLFKKAQRDAKTPATPTA